MKIANVVVVYTTPRNKEQKISLDTVKGILKKYKINFVLANRDKLKNIYFKNRDLAIAVGGDGTFLRASQFIKKGMIFGVNAEPHDKEGFFMKSDKKDFERNLSLIIKGIFKTRRLPRLEADIGGKRISSLALNEFYIGPRKGYHAAKYVISIGRRKERQKSSGVLVTTPAGSYAWARACSTSIMPLGSKSFQYVVREPYKGKVFGNYSLECGYLKSEEVKITSEMLDGVVVADSVGKEYSLKHGQTVTIKLSKEPLDVIWV